MIKTSQGTVIIITFLILVVLLLLGSYFLIFTLTESRISKSQKAGTQTYYLAEAGINEAIWKLKNDETIKNDFLNGTFSDNEEIVSRDNVFGDDNAGYSVTAVSTALAEASLTATSTYQIADREAKRVIKTEVFRALGALTEDCAIFTGGASKNVVIASSAVTIYGGNLYSGNKLDIKRESVVKVYDDPTTEDNPDTENVIENLEGQVLAVGDLEISSDSILDICEVKCADNKCETCTQQDVFCESCAQAGSSCPPSQQEVPLVDFDFDYPECTSPNSFKCRAQALSSVYSASDFEDLLWNAEDGTLTLNNEITYVTGNINLKGGRNLIVNGILVADGNIYIGEEKKWIRDGQTDEGFSQLKINQPSGLSPPSGLLAQGKISFGSYVVFPQDPDIEGVIYACNWITIESVTDVFDIKGGIITRKLDLNYLEQLNITLNNDIIRYGLGYEINGALINPTFSPTINIDHWEESY